MIWHQILLNGLQNTVLALLAVMLSLVLIEEAITTLAVLTRTAGTATLLRTATTAFLSGVHFICSLKNDALGTVPNASSVPFASTRQLIDRKLSVRCQKSEVGGRRSEDKAN